MDTRTGQWKRLPSWLPLAKLSRLAGIRGFSPAGVLTHPSPEAVAISGRLDMRLCKRHVFDHDYALWRSSFP